MASQEINASENKFQEESDNAQMELSSKQRQKNFPIVGIGASAGGLEAFETFFTHVSPNSGMAFVLVQHLDPTHESILVDLVKRYTQIPVIQVEDSLVIKVNCIYIIPPNRDMALRQGKLHLMELETQRGWRLPIDFFFRSLAQDQGERASPNFRRGGSKRPIFPPLLKLGEGVGGEGRSAVCYFFRLAI